MLTQDQLLERIGSASGNPPAPFRGETIGEVRLPGHYFSRHVDFSGAVFAGPVDFSNATFRAGADFTQATFRESALFDGSVFEAPSAFIGCGFERGGFFSVATFNAVDFLQSRFTGHARFWRTRFLAPADFAQCRFSRLREPADPRGGEVNFSYACFDDNATFTDCGFEIPLYLHRTIFAGSRTLFDICRFEDAVHLNGRQNDVIFPRFGPLPPEMIDTLERAGVFRPDVERYRIHNGRRLSEFVCFNDILCEPELCEKLDQTGGLTPTARSLITAGWREGARRMFAHGSMISFRGSRFADLERVHCAYLNLDGINLERNILGTAAEQDRFDVRLRSGTYDAFLSHASEDKESIARPLRDRLREMGFEVWMDESEMAIGSGLLASLEEGMKKCRNGIIILSPHSIQKHWTDFEQKELLKASRDSGKQLFFIWHALDEKQVREWSREIADRLAPSTGKSSIEDLARGLARVLRKAG